MTPLTPERLSVLRTNSSQRHLAEKLFVREEFAIVKFRDMDLDDWKVHASRAWAVAGAFVEEIKRYKRKEKASLERQNTSHWQKRQRTKYEP